MSTLVKATLVIRGGLVVDGTGAPPFVADVAIDGESIVAVGPDLNVEGAPQEICAQGLVVAPGWIDVHTHYDGQATWDPLLSPSSNCGVTTVMMGNCGVGFAPCQKELRPFLLELMEAVEDIPGSALHEGIQWEWETFPEYLDALERRQFACDVAAMIGHAGVRTWVLGKRASISDLPGGADKNPVMPEEIERIAAVVREAVAAGAFGFSTSRLLLHRDGRGLLTPGSLAAKEELLQICDAVAEGGGGLFEMSSDFTTYDDLPYVKMDPKAQKAFFQGELAWMAEGMSKHKEKLKVSFATGADMVPFFSQWARKVQKVPGQLIMQLQTRPQSIHSSIASRNSMFEVSKHFRGAYKEAGGNVASCIELLKVASMRKVIMEDMTKFKPSSKVDNLSSQYDNGMGIHMPSWCFTGELLYPWTNTYEPPDETMIKNLATQRGQTALDVMYDLLLDIQGPHAGILWRPLFPYKGNNHNIVDALEHENVIPGFNDAGAHCTILSDATYATSNITYFGRDRTIGRRLPLEKLVKLQTGDAAAFFNLDDRGVLKPGKRADLNIIDLEKLKIKAPCWVNDLPTNAGRWTQYTEGYNTTILRGVITFQNHRHTGKLPGRLVRNPLSVGLLEGRAQVRAANVQEHGDSADLSDYAVEISRDGGASAMARVMREQNKRLEETPQEARSRL